MKYLLIVLGIIICSIIFVANGKLGLQILLFVISAGVTVHILNIAMPQPCERRERAACLHKFLSFGKIQTSLILTYLIGIFIVSCSQGFTFTAGKRYARCEYLTKRSGVSRNATAECGGGSSKGGYVFMKQRERLTNVLCGGAVINDLYR